MRSHVPDDFFIAHDIREREDTTHVTELMGDDSDFSPDDEGGSEYDDGEESEDTDGSH